ncbi:MAG TPA: hypothetical protein VFK65_11860 [Candidatus Binatia bacterium]|nr:hypothetical protein [Candidatus Binatia bacterium]
MESRQLQKQRETAAEPNNLTALQLRQLADAAITIKGGIVMTALLACSVISLALIIERVKCGTAV